MVSKKIRIMKKILSVLLVIISLNVYSQDYYPISGEGKHWVVALPDELGFGYYEELWEYYMTGDTIINNLSYKKVYKRNLIVPESMLPPFEAADDYQIFGAIRDNIENKKAYAIYFHAEGYNYECPIGEEYLMFDFSAGINESVDFCTISGDDNIIVDIYEDYFDNNPTRYFLTNKGYLYFEGIGSQNGLFEQIFTPVKNNDEIIPYPILVYYCSSDNCDVILAVDNKTAINSLKTYPNPASSQITFEFSDITNDNILHIKNILGNTIAELPIIKGQSLLKWNCSNISSGVFFYQTEIAGVVYKGKIVVN